MDHVEFSKLASVMGFEALSVRQLPFGAGPYVDLKHRTRQKGFRIAADTFEDILAELNSSPAVPDRPSESAVPCEPVGDLLLSLGFPMDSLEITWGKPLSKPLPVKDFNLIKSHICGSLQDYGTGYLITNPSAFGDFYKGANLLFISPMEISSFSPSSGPVRYRVKYGLGDLSWEDVLCIRLKNKQKLSGKGSGYDNVANYRTADLEPELKATVVGFQPATEVVLAKEKPKQNPFYREIR